MSPGADQALAILCEAYWYPLYGFLRGLGCKPDAAQDLTQAFFVRLLDKDRRMLRQADPGRGRFRSFLLASLKHFAANERERTAAMKRGGGVELRSLDFEWAEGRFQLEPFTEETPDRVFDRRWAVTVLDRALAELRARASEGGRLTHFEHLKVFLTGERPQVDYAATGASLGMSPGAVKVAVHRLRRQFGEAVRGEIRQTVSSPEEVEDELRYLWSAVAR